MKVLVLWAHPEPASLNGALAALAARTLTEAGHEVRVTDLYRDGFAVAASGEDFAQRQNPARLVYDAEQLAATKGGGFAEEIERSLEDLFWCDLLILQFPLWWFSVPAILKGWIDRVFTRKFAFDFGPGGMKGLLTHEKALILNTLGGDEASYREHRWHELLVRPMAEGILGACGVKNVSHRAFYQVPTVGQTERQGMLEEVRALAAAF